MTVPTPALRAVVQGFGLDAPFREMLRAPSRILLSDIGVESVRRWFGIQRIDEILSASTLDPYVVALHDKLYEVDQRRFVVTEVGDGQIVKRTLRARTVREALKRGLTLTINGADRFDTVALHNREFLEYAAGAIAWCNVYVSQSAMSPFDTHTDNHHVIAVQGEGRKHWIVFDPVTGDTVFDDWLYAGQSLFVPAHWSHRVHGGEEASVHWTFGLSLNTDPYYKLEDFVAKQVKEGSLDSAQATLTEHLSSDAVRLHSDLFRRRVGASLAYSLLSKESVPLGDIRIRFGSRLPPVLGLHEEAVLVVAAGSLYKVDRRVLPLLTMLTAGVNAPASALSTTIGETAARTFIEWGVGNGLLIASIERTEQS